MVTEKISCILNPVLKKRGGGSIYGAMETSQALFLNWVPLLVILSVGVLAVSVLKTMISDYRADKNSKKK